MGRTSGGFPSLCASDPARGQHPDLLGGDGTEAIATGGFDRRTPYVSVPGTGWSWSRAAAASTTSVRRRSP